MEESGSRAPRRILLHTFGTIDLIDAEGKEVRSLLAQSKRLALLVYLALAPPPHFRRRDKVIALFWPALDNEHARGALRQALSYLRQSLGTDTVLTRGTDDIGVSRELIACDVSQFERAMTSGDAATALSVYRGEFLDGLHVSDNAHEFDEWVAGERSRLRTMARRGARTLADDARLTGDAAAEEHWARRAYALAGRDEIELVQLLRLLDAKGERAGALRLYDDFEHRIKQELDGTPSPETQSLIAQIRARTLAPRATRNPSGRDVPPERETESEVADAARVTRGRHPSRRDRDRASLPTSRRRIMTLAGAGFLAVAGIVAVGYARRESAALDPRRVAVLRLENETGDPALDALGDVAADMLSRGLADTHVVIVIDTREERSRDAGRGSPRRIAQVSAVGRALGAGSVVLGSYYRRADSLAFEIRLTDVRTDAVIQVMQQSDGSMTEPMRAMEALRQRVMVAFAVRFDPQFASYQGSSQPASYEAYQEFLAGDQYRLREGIACPSDCTVEELAHYRRAYSLDTNFTLPLARAAWSSLWGGACARTDSIAAYLRPRHDRLPAGDRVALDGAVALCHGERTRALELAREALVVNPQSDAAVLMLAFEARRSGRLHESIELMRKLDTARVGSHRQYWGNLMAPYHLLGEHTLELTAAAGNRRLFPNKLEAIAYEALALVGLGRIPEVEQRLDEMISVPTNALQERVVAWWIDEVAGDLDAHGYAAEARVVFERAANWCESRPAEELKDDQDDCARALYYAGDFEAARKIVARGAKEEPKELAWQSLLGAVAAHRGDRREVERVDRWLGALRGPYLAGAPTFERARIAAVLGDKERAVALLRLAIDQGATVFGIGFGLHSDPDFRLLRGYPPFEELLRAKG